jgi:hypothetical protein
MAVLVVFLDRKLHRIRKFPQQSTAAFPDRFPLVRSAAVGMDSSLGT